MERRSDERRKQTRIESLPSIEEARAVFHRIWTSQVGKEGYSKRDWQVLRQMIALRTGLNL